MPNGCKFSYAQICILHIHSIQCLENNKLHDWIILSSWIAHHNHNGVISLSADTTNKNWTIASSKWYHIFYELLFVNRVKLALIKLCQLWQGSHDLYEIYRFIEWTCLHDVWYICTHGLMSLWKCDSIVRLNIHIQHRKSKATTSNHIPIRLLQSIDAHLRNTHVCECMLRIITIIIYCIIYVPCTKHLNGFGEWMSHSRALSNICIAIKSTFVHLQMGEKVGIQVHCIGIIISWYILRARNLFQFQNECECEYEEWYLNISNLMKSPILKYILCCTVHSFCHK